MWLFPHDEGQRLSLTQVFNNAPADALFYLCGPARLLDEVLRVANDKGIDPSHLRYEYFSVAPQLLDQPMQVELARTGITIEVVADESVHDALLRNGVSIPYSCLTGQCHSCATEVLSGAVDHRDSALSEHERESRKLMCPCVSWAVKEKLCLNL